MKESRIAFGSVAEANGSCRIVAQLSAVIIFPLSNVQLPGRKDLKHSCLSYDVLDM